MNIVKKIIDVVLTFIILFSIIFLGLYLFKIEPFVVLSGSMGPKIETGSLCLINKNYKYESIKEKDIVSYKLNDGTMVIHRVIEKNNDKLVTKGDANESPDISSPTKSNYVGKNIFCVPKIGYAVRALQSNNGKIVLTSIIILLLLVGFLFGEPDKKNTKKELKKEETKEEDV